MINHQATQIIALIRSGRMINIGGRPVLVPNPHQPTAGRTYSIQIALAFAAIYLVWGSTYLAIRYAVETIPPLVTAGIRHSIAGAIMFAWAWARGFRPTRAHWISGIVVGALFFLIGHGTLHWAEQYVGSGLAALLIATRTHVHSAAGVVDGAAEDQPAQRTGPGFRRARRGPADRRGVDHQRLELAGAAGCARGIVIVVGWSGDLSQAQAAFGCAGTHGAPDDLRRGHAARNRGTYGESFMPRIGRASLSNRFWVWRI